MCICDVTLRHAVDIMRLGGFIGCYVRVETRTHGHAHILFVSYVPCVCVCVWVGVCVLDYVT